MDAPINWLLILVPALPLMATLLTAALGARLLKQWSHIPVIVAFLGSFVCSCALLNAVRAAPEREHGKQHLVTLWSWVSVADAYDQHVDENVEGPPSATEPGLKDFCVDVTLRVDPLTAVMLCMVTFISTLVAIFAVGYMHGDEGYWRFFTYIGLFVFSMTMLVVASSFVLLFVFWEAVGVCSYLLIGYWYTKPEAAAAGMKAFLVNRVGDFGFTLAMLLIWVTYGTLNFHDAVHQRQSDGTVQVVTDPQTVEALVAAKEAGAESDANVRLVRGVLGASRIRSDDYVRGSLALSICLLLMLGACGKSAQFPLHVWLPDAMEGPTPVSALIHAATMVTAGVYMVTRCTPLFLVSPEAQLVVAGIGGFTALLAGLIALTQNDLKRVLAYSTISQLGYMFLALGTGSMAGIVAGMFHLFTHAFFKALLFLGSGSVMHAMGNVIDMRQFSGLRRLMPVTHGTFLVGCLALAGICPLAGFWSKDAIVASVHDRVHEMEHVLDTEGRHEDSPHQVDDAAQSEVRGGTHAAAPWSGLSQAQLGTQIRAYKWLYYGALFTAFLTAFYTFRAFFMTFYGPLKVPSEAGDHAHESPWLMTVPLVILAVCAAVVGVWFDQSAFSGPNRFAGFLAGTPSLTVASLAATPQPGIFHLDVAAISTLIALGGIGTAAYLYLGDNREVSWLKSVFDFEWLAQVFDADAVSRLGRLPWVKAINQAMGRVGLGWLAQFLGQVLLIVVVLLSAPLIVGRYVSPYRLSKNKFYFDEIYDWLIVKPCRWLARACFAVDRGLIDGIVDFLGRIPIAIGGLMRSMQTGLVQFYALGMVLAVVVLLLVQVFWRANG